MMLDFLVLLPTLIIATGAILLMLLAAMESVDENTAPLICLGVLALAFIVQLGASMPGDLAPYSTLLGSMLLANTFTKVASLIILGCGLFSVMIAQSYFTENRFGTPEFYCLLLFAVSGMLLLTMAAELITLFISLEIMSLAVYVMVGYDRTSGRCAEAVLKYLMLGAFAGALFTMGSALIYAAVGSTRFTLVAAHVGSTGLLTSPALAGGAFLILVALLFKSAAFPFHAWVVDVYDGAPVPVTGFMATAVKTAVFAVFANFLLLEGEMKAVWLDYLFYISILTMFAGNLIAIGQDSLKRMLAASGIVHTGYLLIGLVAVSTDDFTGSVILYYLAAYGLSTLGIFTALAYLGGPGEKRATFDDFKGLAKVRPYSAGAIAIFLLSMAGIPPTVGFMGKLYIIVEAIRAGYMALAVLAIVSSILSMWYYLRLIITMYFKEPEERFETAGMGLAPVGTLILAVCVFAFGLYPVVL